jgi:hypothetical protein
MSRLGEHAQIPIAFLVERILAISVLDAVLVPRTRPTGSRHEPVPVNQAAELVGPSQPRRIGMPD